MFVRIHERVRRRHPELSNDDVRSAWSNAFLIQERWGDGLPDGTLVALGIDGRGRLLEMIGVLLVDDTVLIYHAMTPPTKKELDELRGMM